MISSRGALLHESRKKMAAAKRRVAAKSSNRSLDEILVEADEFVNEMKKAGKKQKKQSRYLIFRDPITGKRESKYPYKPRFQREEIEQSENVDLPSTNEGNFNIMITMLTYIKLIQS